MSAVAQKLILFIVFTRSNSSGSSKKEVKRKRPTILHRRNSRSQAIKDWGERCVDVFEVIAQIGEGTYGQVILAAINVPPNDSAAT